MIRSKPTLRPYARGALAGALFLGLAGCSTVKSLSPFGSSVPYAQEITPTVPRPPSPDQHKAKPDAASPSAAAIPQTEVKTAEASPPASKQAPNPPPAAAPLPPAVAPAAAAPAPAAAAPVPAPAGATAAPAAAASAGQPPAAPAAPEAAQQADTQEDKPPSIPPERRQFKDDGRYPNLAQVPSRPTDLPTFAEAAALRKTLEADRAQGGATATAPVQTAAVPVATGTVASRTEDRMPCMGAPGSGQPTATVHFAQGSSALTADERGALAEAIPTVRGSDGTVRILGHGDADPGAQGQRFDLAMARADAVAQALAGLGIPVTRLAIGVGCTDAAAAGASVQLYLQS